jgi:uncharacterized protein
MMKIGIISDTHGERVLTRQALDALDRYGVGLTIHCGDIGFEIVPLFAGRQTHFVAGNTDNTDLLRKSIDAAKHTFHDELGTLEIDGCRIAFLHGHDMALLNKTIHSGHWDLVCHGHTHTFSSSREGSTLVLNPGALARTDFPSVAVVELPSMEVTEIPL